MVLNKYVREAWPDGSEFAGDRDVVLRYTIAIATIDARLQSVCKLVDPVNLQFVLGHEDGSSVARRLQPGQWREAVLRSREGSLRSGLTPDGQADPKYSVGLQQAFERIRARATAEMKQPLPSPDEDPHHDWPLRARFKAELDLVKHEDYGVVDTQNPVVYYDAPTFERFLSRVLDVIEAHRPEKRNEAGQVRKHLRWWAEHDAKHLPGAETAMSQP